VPVAKLKEFLDSNHVKYVSIAHSVAYTAQEIASVTHIPGKELAKVVMVKIDGNLVMAVVPASRQVDLDRLRVLAEGKTVSLAGEKEFKDRFPDCETGAMPPFGELYGIPVYVDSSLAEDEDIAFNAGTHRELIRLSYQDFVRLAAPAVGSFA